MPSDDPADPRARFGPVAARYQRGRPSYPSALVDWVLAQAGLPARATSGAAARLADIGCGTGIATRLFAERGFDMIGVDPSAAMLDEARARGGATYVLGEATATTLPDASVALVIVAQALHWFELDPALREFERRVVIEPGGTASSPPDPPRFASGVNPAAERSRVQPGGTASSPPGPPRSSAGVNPTEERSLVQPGETASSHPDPPRAGGVCAAFWNQRAPSAFDDDYDPLLRRFSTTYQGRSHAAPVLAELRASPRVAELRQARFAASQILDQDALLDRVHSSSYVAHGVTERAAFDAALRQLFERHQQGGRVTLEYETLAVAWLARRGRAEER